MDWGYSISSIFAELIPIIAIAGVFLIVALKVYARTRVRELEIRERIAMIEKGLVPPPEVDPHRFEESLHPAWMRAYGPHGARYRRFGIILIGIGLGLMVLISLAGGDPADGLGVGGFIAVLGAAFWVAGWLERPSSSNHLSGSPGGTPPFPPGGGPGGSSAPPA